MPNCLCSSLGAAQAQRQGGITMQTCTAAEMVLAGEDSRAGLQWVLSSLTSNKLHNCGRSGRDLGLFRWETDLQIAREGRVGGKGVAREVLSTWTGRNLNHLSKRKNECFALYFYMFSCCVLSFWLHSLLSGKIFHFVNGFREYSQMFWTNVCIQSSGVSEHRFSPFYYSFGCSKYPKP